MLLKDNRAVIKRWGTGGFLGLGDFRLGDFWDWGISPGYYECGPQLLSQENTIMQKKNRTK